MTSERLKDLVGRQVVLIRNLTTQGGEHFIAGTVMTVDSTWRGKFMLSVLGGPDGEGGCPRGIRKVHRRDFEPI